MDSIKLKAWRRAVVWIGVVFASVGASVGAPGGARAEYRVYRLEITDSANGATRQLESTLDHLQYSTYHALRPTELVRLVDTWMCRGRRGDYLPLCENPKTTQLTDQVESPASPSN